MAIALVSQPDVNRTHTSQGCCLEYVFTSTMLSLGTSYEIRIENLDWNDITEGTKIKLNGQEITFVSSVTEPSIQVLIDANTYDNFSDFIDTYYSEDFEVSLLSGNVFFKTKCVGTFSGTFDFSGFSTLDSEIYLVTEASNTGFPINYGVEVEVYVAGCIINKQKITPVLIKDSCDDCLQSNSYIISFDIEPIVRSYTQNLYTPTDTLSDIPTLIISNRRNVYIKYREYYQTEDFTTFWGSWNVSDTIKVLHANCSDLVDKLQIYDASVAADSKGVWLNYDSRYNLCCGSDFLAYLYTKYVNNWAYYAVPSCVRDCQYSEPDFNINPALCYLVRPPGEPEPYGIKFQHRLLSTVPLTFVSGTFKSITYIGCFAGTTAVLNSVLDDPIQTGYWADFGVKKYQFNFGEIFLDCTQTRRYEVVLRDSCLNLHTVTYDVHVPSFDCNSITLNLISHNVTYYKNIIRPVGAPQHLGGSLYAVNLNNIITEYCDCAELDIYVVYGADTVAQTFSGYITDDPIKLTLLKGTQCCCDDTLHYLGGNGMYNTMSVSCDLSQDIESSVEMATDCPGCELITESLQSGNYRKSRSLNKSTRNYSYKEKSTKRTNVLKQGDESEKILNDFIVSTDILDYQMKRVYLTRGERNIFRRGKSKYISIEFTLYKSRINKGIKLR